MIKKKITLDYTAQIIETKKYRTGKGPKYCHNLF